MNDIEFKKIYCDFDGTISKKDTVVAFLEAFGHPCWLEDEQRWRQGEISSRECLTRQVAALPEMAPEALEEFLETVEIDDYFLEFHNFLCSNNIELVILSDGFDLFIKKTLERHSLGHIKYFANSLVHKSNVFSISFNNHSKHCTMKAGSCKCSKVSEEKFCYIGDGTSDICIAKKADKLFAKSTLEKYCRQMNLNHIKFDTFKDVLRALGGRDAYGISNTVDKRQLHKRT